MRIKILKNVGDWAKGDVVQAGAAQAERLCLTGYAESAPEKAEKGKAA